MQTIQNSAFLKLCLNWIFFILIILLNPTFFRLCESFLFYNLISFSYSVFKMGKPASVKDVDQSDIVIKIADFLKKSGKVTVPEWADLVKLGRFNELAPIDPDWYYIRTASIARRLYIRQPAGLFYLPIYLFF
jgi:hypothetical protein